MELTNKQEVVVTKFLSEKLPPINNDIKRINNGGCGIFAKLLSDKLDKLGISHEIYGFLSDWSISDGGDIEEFIRTKNLDLEISVSHMGLKIGENFIDSTGIINGSWGIKRKKFVFPKVVLEIMVDDSQNDKWNSDFDRKNIPKIEERLNKIFEDFPILELTN